MVDSGQKMDAEAKSIEKEKTKQKKKREDKRMALTSLCPRCLTYSPRRLPYWAEAGPAQHRRFPLASSTALSGLACVLSFLVSNVILQCADHGALQYAQHACYYLGAIGGKCSLIMVSPRAGKCRPSPIQDVCPCKAMNVS
jgi:hypothetical protein